MSDVSKSLRWRITEKGARITGFRKRLEGALAIPSCLNGVAVVEIGEEAFCKCNSIVSVEIPDTVEVVGARAFFECFSLKELHLGTGIKKIERHAFKGCSSLRRVVLPSTLEELSPDAFDESVELLDSDDMKGNDDVARR